MQEKRLACGRSKLLLARYTEEAATFDTNAIKQYYRDACEVNPQWEDGHFHLAMYYDRLLNSLEKKEKPVEWIHHIILRYVFTLLWLTRKLCSFCSVSISTFVYLDLKVISVFLHGQFLYPVCSLSLLLCGELNLFVFLP